MGINEISGQIVDAAMKVHSALGPGLLESAYEACLIYELHKRGLHVQSQVPVPIYYESVTSIRVTGWICWSKTPWS